MSINPVAAVMQVLQPDLVAKIAGALGIDPPAAAKAVSAAVPAVLGGYARKAASPDGARDLGALIEAQDPDVRGQLGALLNGNAQADILAAGLKLFERALGGPAKDVLIGALGKYAGLEPQKIAGLLGIITPVVTAILAGYQKAGVGNGGGAVKLLATQQAGIDASLPTQFATMFAEAGGAPQATQISGALASGMATAVASAAAAVLATPPVDAAAAEAKVAKADAAAAVKGATVTPVAVETTKQPAASAVVPAEHVQPPPVPARKDAAAVPAQTSADASKAVAPPPPRAQQTPAHEAVSAPPPAAPTTSVAADPSPEQPIVERRRGVPVAAWLLPLVFIIAGAVWFWQANISAERELAAAAQARRIEEQKAADAARLRADADAAAARQKAEMEAAAKVAEDARRKEEADKAAVAAAGVSAAETRQRAEAEAAAKTAAEAKQRAEADAARLAAEAESKQKAEADAAAKAAAGAKQKAEADAAAQKARLEAEAKRKAEADAARLAAEAESKRKAEADATAKAAAAAQPKAASEAKVTRAAPAIAAKTAGDGPRADTAPCLKTVRNVAALARLQFDWASASIRDETPLIRVASSLKKCPPARVRVEGHSDSFGDINRNQALSEDRAKAVASFLVSSGVAAERVATKGYGETRPIALNDTESNRARNRRIEIVVE